MSKLKRVVLFFLIIAIITSFNGTAVFADSSAKDISASDAFTIIEDYLNSNVRYDDVDKASLSNGALKAILTEHPELYDEAMKGMLSSIDENSVYFTPEEFKRFNEQLDREVCGIGVNVLSQEGNLIISSTFKDSPAERVGLKAGDIIVSADGVNLTGLDMDLAVSYIRGEAGTSVELGIKRSGMGGIMSLTVIREVINSVCVSYEVLDKEDGTKVAHVIISAFNSTVYDDLVKVLDEIDKLGIKNVILDLRNNPGGYFDQAIKIAELFVPSQAVITTEQHKGPLNSVIYKSAKIPRDYNLAVLINGMSASSSEVLTAALKDNKAAKVIGTKSYGKGTVQSVLALKTGAAIKFTVAYYLTPNGENIHKIGIIPDAVVENESASVDISKFSKFGNSQVYSFGDRGEDIKTAKEILSYMGVYLGEVNDIFDEGLESAIKVFQSATGLFSYGVLDLTTQYQITQTLSECKENTDNQLQAALDAF